MFAVVLAVVLAGGGRPAGAANAAGSDNDPGDSAAAPPAWCAAYRLRPAGEAAGGGTDANVHTDSGNVPDVETGFLYSVRVGSTPPSLLFGTFHSADDAVIDTWSWLLPSLGALRPRVLIVERDLGAAVDPSLQMLPAGERLSDRLSGHPGLFAAARRLAARYGIDGDALDRMRLWFAAALLNQIAAMPRGPDRVIIDQLLQRSAGELGIPLRPLEDFADIAGYYDSAFSEDDQIRLLAEAVCNQALLTDSLARQTAAFAADDAAAFDREIRRYDGSSAGLADRLNRVFVAQRNASFWPQIWPELQRGGAVVALGNLHLHGDGGLLASLRARDGRQGRDAGATDDVAAVSAAGDDIVIEVLAPEVLAPPFDWSRYRELPRFARRWLRDNLEAYRHPPDGNPPPVVLRSLPALRRLLCPGRSCRIESSYRRERGEILLALPQYALLLGPESAGRDYVASLLVRELTRHRLAGVADRLLGRLRGRDPALTAPALDACLDRILLHYGSLAQQHYLRLRGVGRDAHIFALDPRCPRL